MIILEYLFWILFIGYCYFVAMRLKWLYEKAETYPFWQKASAQKYYLAAGVLFFVIALALLQHFHVIFLLILLLGEYVLIASPAVKVGERGIMANALLARWPDVLQAKRMRTSGEVMIVTKHPWLRMCLQVPAEKENAFRKMLAVKGIVIIDEENEKSAAAEQNVLQAESVSENKTPQPEADIKSAYA